MSITLDEVQAMHEQVQLHHKAVTDLQNQNAELRAQIKQHEQTLTGIVNRWEVLATAFQPPAVTRPLMAIPVQK
jgi:phage shock protein A